jgi:hypothetical protein
LVCRYKFAFCVIILLAFWFRSKLTSLIEKTIENIFSSDDNDSNSNYLSEESSESEEESNSENEEKSDDSRVNFARKFDKDENKNNK